VDPDAVEIRVLGCLLEKQRTTPDAYPLTLNALRLACNQTTNRDPVVDYDEAQIRAALSRLAQRRWTRAASGAGSRAAKFRHLFDQALGLADDEVAVLTVLMLRGPQTVGELRGALAAAGWWGREWHRGRAGRSRAVACRACVTPRVRNRGNPCSARTCLT
jgi:uncharacterized protein YceH (UPF0502 family)